ncbi:MAG: hypothetical protein FLDDKLPJ_00366 [Phycisphaerae bacterium]|nr:hypothetical protein [Phycisphaerae bacterium]
MNLRSVVALGIATSVCGATAAARGQNWEQKAKLFADDRERSDYFGTRIARWGELALIAALHDDDHGSSSGAVYAFELADGVWLQTAKLTADDGAAYDYFGASIAFCKGVAVIGADGDDGLARNAGSAYVFEQVNGAWLQSAKLEAADAERDDDFGSAVALFDETVLIGAPGDDVGGYSRGSAYVFERTDGTWSQTAHLTADDGVNWDEFGSAVALSGDTALIGVQYRDDGGSNSGSVYVFEKVGGAWTQTAKLAAEDPQEYAAFGFSIALLGDTALIGAYRDDGPSVNSGSAYVFEISGGRWRQTAKLSAADGGEGDYFGYSVLLTDGAALVGAPNHDGRRPETGAVYRFERVHGRWVQTDKLSPVNGRKESGFGVGLALAEDTALIGAGFDGAHGMRSGAVYVFDPVPPPDCTGNERIAHTQCRSHNDVNRLSIALKGGSGSPADTFTVTLSDGRSEWGRLTPRGKARVKFMELPAGEGSVTATWDCGATAEKTFTCGDPSGWQDAARLTADDGAEDDEFGDTVALSGETVLVGASGDDDRGRNSGSAYIYEKFDGAWTQTVKLTPADGAQDDFFGRDVALSGDTAMIGAYRDDDRGNDSGSVYVYERHGGAWSQAAKLTADDGTSSDYFGISLALSGDRALIGALDANNGRGAVYVFEKTDGYWSQDATLAASDAWTTDDFGLSIAFAGDTAIVGARRENRDRGAAYIFEKVNGEWEEVIKLTAGNRERYAYFGWSVAVSGNTAFVGAPGSIDSSVYIFEKVDGAWVQTAKLSSRVFGLSLAVSGDTVLIGAPYDDNRRKNSGAAYLYRNVDGVWTQVDKFTGHAGYKNSGFGGSVALSTLTAVVGATNDGDKDFRPGTAYISERAAPPACAGEERILSVECTQHDGVNTLILQLEGGAPHDTYAVKLSSGESKSGTLSSEGTAKAKLQAVTSGDGTAVVTWGCGATGEGKYTCP